MTREEAREHLKDILDDVPNDKCIDWIEALNLAIKTLEQEPILDKIRAEVEAYQSDAFYPDDVMMNRRMVLEIIDKYRGESDCRECKAEHDCYECEKYAESEE